MTEPVIKISNIKTKSKLDLSNQTLTINRGDKVAILGQQDSGKSLIFEVLLNNLPYSGDIEFSDSDDKLGVYLKQNDYPSRLKVKELVKLVLDKSQQSKDFYHVNQLDEIKNVMLQNLTELEQRQLTLALVLAQSPAIALIDELTTGLDTKIRQELTQQLHQQTQDATVLNATYYFDEVEGWANKVWVMYHVQSLFFGKIEDFLSNYRHYAYLKVSYNHLPDDLIAQMKQQAIVLSKKGDVFVDSEEKSDVILNLLIQQKQSYQLYQQNLQTTFLLALLQKEGDCQ